MGPSAIGWGLPGVTCHRGTCATFDFLMNYVYLFMFWTCLILVFVFKMCAAFALGKLQFGHVFGRCAGHMLFIFLLFILYCDRFVVAGAPLEQGPSATGWVLARGPLSQGNLCNIGFYKLC